MMMRTGILPHRPVQMHMIRRQRQHQTGFRAAGVNAFGFFTLGKKLPGSIRHPPSEYGKQTEIRILSAQITGHYFHHLRLTAVSVDQNQLAEPHAVHTLADIPKYPQQGVGLENHRSRELNVLVGFTAPYRR